MKIIYLFTLLAFLQLNHGIVQVKLKKNTIVDFSFVYDTNSLNALNEYFEIGLDVQFHQNENKKTFGLSKGKYPWRKFHIKVSEGVFSEGRITFNKKKVIQKGNQIKLEITPLNNPSLVKNFMVDIPFLMDFEVDCDIAAGFSLGSKIPLSIKAEYSKVKFMQPNLPTPNYP